MNRYIIEIRRAGVLISTPRIAAESREQAVRSVAGTLGYTIVNDADSYDVKFWVFTLTEWYDNRVAPRDNEKNVYRCKL